MLDDLSTLLRAGENLAPGDAWAHFRSAPEVAMIGWPDDVAEQFLFDHGRKTSFIQMYGHLDLSGITWEVQSVSLADLLAVTSATHLAHVEQVRLDPDHWIGNWRASRRDLGWSTIGTWRRRPVFLVGKLLEPPRAGLHLVEGHTRLGILRGLADQGRLNTGSRHEIWLGSGQNVSRDGAAPYE